MNDEKMAITASRCGGLSGSSQQVDLGRSGARGVLVGAMLLSLASLAAPQSTAQGTRFQGWELIDDVVRGDMDGVQAVLAMGWLEHAAIAKLGPWTLSSELVAPWSFGLSRAAPTLRAPRSPYEATASFEHGEVFAIQRHLGFVLERLAKRDVSSFSPARRAQRQLQIERLSEYHKRGVFPHNSYRPDLTPAFIDEHGRACAVAYLMIESGALELAERVSTVENLAYVPEIATPGLALWIEQSGLDAAECAMIQPSYGQTSGPWVGLGGSGGLSFSGRPRQGQAPLVVRFRGSWHQFLDPLHATWSWNFGDGRTSSLQNPTHIYTAPGTYTVSLTSTMFPADRTATKTKVGYIVVLP